MALLHFANPHRLAGWRRAVHGIKSGPAAAWRLCVPGLSRVLVRVVPTARDLHLQFRIEIPFFPSADAQGLFRLGMGPGEGPKIGNMIAGAADLVTNQGQVRYVGEE